MSEPFTIRIFVPDGDPEGTRFIDRMNWTGLGIAFPRSDWPNLKGQDEVRRTGVYILVGYSDSDPDLPKLYIGQGDDISGRLESHFRKKEFWDWGVCFVSNSGGLNRAHVTWLECALVSRALKADRSILDNGNTPQEPSLTLAEKADTRSFLKEILQILPLVGLRAFEDPKPVATPTKKVSTSEVPSRSKFPDTVIVPAQNDGFRDVFLRENCWHAIRISGGMLDKIKYIAAYQTSPTTAITHFAPVDRIEPYGESGKYRLVFAKPATEIGPIPYADAPSGAMQGPRYTTFEKLKSAKKLTDLF